MLGTLKAQKEEGKLNLLIYKVCTKWMNENLLRIPRETWQFLDKRCLRSGAIKPDDFLTELETCHVINRIPGVPVKLTKIWIFAPKKATKNCKKRFEFSRKINEEKCEKYQQDLENKKKKKI